MKSSRTSSPVVGGRKEGRKRKEGLRISNNDDDDVIDGGWMYLFSTTDRPLDRYNIHISSGPEVCGGGGCVFAVFFFVMNDWNWNEQEDGMNKDLTSNEYVI